MRKYLIVIILIVLILVGVFIIIHNNTKYKIKVDFDSDNEKVSIGEEILLQIKVNKEIIATNFELIYDTEAFDLIGSETENFMVAKKNDKIACIYANITGKGTDTFKLKLKAIKESKADFQIINSKFREVGKDESYVGDQIQGINKKINIQIIK